MLQRGDYAREICNFVVVYASPFPLQPVTRYKSIHSFFFFLFFFLLFLLFCVAQAFKRRFCSGIYMLLFGVSASNYAPFLGIKYSSKRRLCS